MTIVGPRDIVTVSRADFLASMWAYEPGQHVTIIGPTGCGKTRLCLDLLARSATRRLRGVLLVMKPRDPTAQAWRVAQGWPRVTSWPPGISLTNPDPPGHVLWPKPTFVPERDHLILHRQFRAAMLDSYKRGNRIVVADEAGTMVELLKLHTELTTLAAQGRSMGCGCWVCSQRAARLPLQVYQAQRLFLFRDQDKRNLERFGEIGGVDPKFVEYTVGRLPRFHALYINQEGPYGCIIAPS